MFERKDVKIVGQIPDNFQAQARQNIGKSQISYNLVVQRDKKILKIF